MEHEVRAARIRAVVWAVAFLVIVATITWLFLG